MASQDRSRELARHRGVCSQSFTLSPLQRTPTSLSATRVKLETPGNTLSWGWVRFTLSPDLERCPPTEHSCWQWGSEVHTLGWHRGRSWKSTSSRLSLEHPFRSSSPSSEFGRLPELFPRVVSSLACRQVWMFCQHSREFMIACRCVSKNTLYPKQKLMQA